ncbi:MAG TPA: DUF4440 domain-containing protein, partial [Puia sp.]|nr:DUF4440 domain-containing protein [Puia sp.]
ELAKALQNNDTAGIYRILDKDWAVIPSTGVVLEGPGVFPSGIRTGYRTLRVMELSEPRVRLYGNIALVTTKVRLSGQLGGKSYDDLKMRQTDVLRWEHGEWKCVLTQEAVVNEQQKGSEGTQVQSMGHYWFVLFNKGSDWGQDSAATTKLFQEHIHYIISQRKIGKIITGGAFLDKVTWIGFEIYSCTTSEEVEKITEADPAVSSKILSYEIHPWATLKGEVKFE